MKYFVIGLLWLFPIISIAAVYSHEKNGQVTYSDTPLTNNDTEINVPAINTSPLLETGQTNPAPEKKQIENIPYTAFSITSPANGATIQNQPVITLTVKVEPKLQEGDTIQIYLDGNPIGPPSDSTSFSLNHIDRGQHQMYAVLLNNEKTMVKKTESITIYVHYGKVSSSNTPDNSTSFIHVEPDSFVQAEPDQEGNLS